MQRTQVGSAAHSLQHTHRHTHTLTPEDGGEGFIQFLYCVIVTADKVTTNTCWDIFTGELPAGVGGLPHLEHVPTQRGRLVVRLQLSKTCSWFLPKQEPLQRSQEKQLTGQLLPLLLPLFFPLLIPAADSPTQTHAKDSGYIHSQMTVHLLLQVRCRQPPLGRRRRRMRKRRRGGVLVKDINRNQLQLLHRVKDPDLTGVWRFRSHISSLSDRETCTVL